MERRRPWVRPPPLRLQRLAARLRRRSIVLCNIWQPLHSSASALVEWEEIQTAFEWDGSWRDLYVLGASRDDWQRILDALRSSGYVLRFWRDHDAQPVPESVDSLFVGESEQSSLLSTVVEGVTVNAHFFQDDEVEFDIDPREVSTVARAEAVFGLMRLIGQAVQKPVRLTPENMSELVLIGYDPASDSLRKEHEFRGLL